MLSDELALALSLTTEPDLDSISFNYIYSLTLQSLHLMLQPSYVHLLSRRHTIEAYIKAWLFAGIILQSSQKQALGRVKAIDLWNAFKQSIAYPYNNEVFTTLQKEIDSLTSHPDAFDVALMAHNLCGAGMLICSQPALLKLELAWKH